MDKLKLKWKIFGFLLGFCMLLIMILWMFQTVFLNDMYKWIRKGEIEKAITLIGENIDNDNLQTILNELERTKEIMVMPTRKFVAPDVPPPDNRKSRPETLTKTMIFTLKSGEEILLTFHAIITPVNATVSTLQTQLYIISAIMIILSIILAIIISKIISKPIEEINESAKILALGDYDIHFAGSGFFEIMELADTLNTAAKELSKVENLRRELMANISHDLRTPLALIYSYAELMHDFSDEITPEHTQIIMDETQRLSTLVDDVLDISKLENGAMELNCQSYNLTKSITDIIERMSELIKKDGYRIRFEHDQDIFVYADEIKIIQVFYNLLINAITYSGADKLVTVRQIYLDTAVKIEVIDNGAGISEENLSSIWDRYYKSDKAHKRGIIGTGLGLSIVKKTMYLHEGCYGVKSTKGEGSTFWFSLNL